MCGMFHKENNRTIASVRLFAALLRAVLFVTIACGDVNKCILVGRRTLTGYMSRTCVATICLRINGRTYIFTYTQQFFKLIQILVKHSDIFFDQYLKSIFTNFFPKERERERRIRRGERRRKTNKGDMFSQLLKNINLCSILEIIETFND